MFISPMLLHKSEQPFNDPNNICELKLDGIRLLVSNMDRLKLYTRHNNDVTANFPELHAPPIPPGTIIDCEMIVTGADGKPDFEAVMSRFQSRRKTPNANLTVCAFDIIYHRGKDVTGLPLLRRKEFLEETLQEDDRYKKVRYLDGSAAVGLFDAVKALGLEGIVIKKVDSRYEKDRRSNSWLKVINYEEATVYITGYRKSEFGWLIGLEESGRIRNVGVMELGVGERERKAIWPLFKRSGEGKDMVYVEPQFRCKVKFRNWTKAGMMRLPVFQEFKI